MATRTPPKKAVRTRQDPASLTASGERVDFADRNLTQRINRQRASWQKLAWNYRELIGELGSGIDYEANIISKVDYTIAQASDEGEPVVQTDDEYEVPEHVATAAREALDRLPFRNGYSFTGILSTCLRVSGEAWLHGRTSKGKERWQVLSSDEVVPVGNKLGIVDMPGVAPEPIDTNREALLRLWKPHPRWKRLSDSPLRRMLDTCEDIVLIGRELRAASRSRVAANGILIIPHEVSIVRKPDGRVEDFQTELEITLLAPIANEGDAGAVVPVVLRGPAEHIDKVKHIVLEREDSPQLIDKLEAALRRLREGMDMPPDANQSVKDMNHWSAWSVTTENWKNYLEPHCRLIVDSITEAYLRPSLMMSRGKGGWGLTEDEADLVRVWYSADNVTQNANRSEDAKAAHEAGEIGGDAYRKALGFSDGDKPSEEEYRRMVTWKAASQITPEVVQALLTQAFGPDLNGVGVTIPGHPPARPTAVRMDRPRIEAGGPNSGPNDSAGRTNGSPGTAPTRPTPATPTGMQGAASPQGVLDSVDLITGESLAEIDRALRDRLMVAADDAVLRALEKAGSRARSSLQQRNRELAAEDVCPRLGEERLGELGLREDSLLAKAFDALGGKFVRWTTQAATQAARLVSDMLHLPLTALAALTRTLTARIPAAWKGLESRLTARALDRLYGRTGDEQLGEVPDTIVSPGDIRAALAEIGGLPPGGVGGDGATIRPDEVLSGLALGRDIVEAIEQRADRVGFSWKYGITPRERQFEPHKRLNGRRFLGWDDAGLLTDASTAWVGTHFAPGDHPGCLCDYVPTWAITETIGTIAMEIEPESVGMGTDRLLAEMDDAAGRKGTYAQRNRDERDRILAVQRDWMERTI